MPFLNYDKIVCRTFQERPILPWGCDEIPVGNQFYTNDLKKKFKALELVGYNIVN